MNDAHHLRRARTLFDRAQADNVSMGEARNRLSAERHARIVARLQRKAATGLCGTVAPAIGGVGPEPTQLQWWQRD